MSLPEAFSPVERTPERLIRLALSAMGWKTAAGRHPTPASRPMSDTGKKAFAATHRRFGRRLALALVIGAIPLLGACSFTPVYGPGPDGQNLAFHYADPTNRLEQIIYQDLKARLTATPGPDSPLVIVSVKSANRKVGRTSNASVFNTYESVLTGVINVYDAKDNQKRLFGATRTARATYDTSGQLLADSAARDDAETRAAQSLADSLRLLLIGAFAHGVAAVDQTASAENANLQAPTVQTPTVQGTGSATTGT